MDGMEDRKSVDIYDFEFDPAPSGNFDPFLDSFLGISTLQPMDGSLQILQPSPAAPISMTGKDITAGMTGMYQQLHEPQRPNSFAGWLTNSDLTLLPNAASPPDFPGGLQDPLKSLPDLLSLDSPTTSAEFTMMPQRKRQGAATADMATMDQYKRIRTDAHTAMALPQLGADGMAFQDARIFGTSVGFPALAMQQPLQARAGSNPGSNESSSPLADGEEGLSKEGLRALREARNREKNRRAQKLFRERSKMKAKENETRVLELEEELRVREAENERQAQRILVLESALVLRQPSENRVNHRGTLRMPEPAARLPAGGDGDMFRPWKGWDDFDPNSTLVLSAREKPIVFTPQAVQQLCWEEFTDVWKDYVNRLAMCLLDTAGDMEAPPGERLVGLINESCALCACVALHNPKLIHKFGTTCLEQGTGAVEAPPDMHRWTKLMTALKLTGKQKKVMLRHRNNFLITFQMLMKERKKVVGQLAGLRLSVEDLSTTNLSPEFLALMAATEQMNRIVEEGHRCAFRFMAMGWREVLTPMQAANFTVQSYPWGPDMMSLGNAIALEQGEGQPNSTGSDLSSTVSGRIMPPASLPPAMDDLHAILMQRQALISAHR